MAAKRTAKKTPAARRVRRPRTTLPPEARAAYAEVKQGVVHIERSITEIQRGLGRAERKIEADARARVRELRREARLQVASLKAKRHEAARSLKGLSIAAGESWREIKQSADAILADARATAISVAERLRNAIGR